MKYKFLLCRSLCSDLILRMIRLTLSHHKLFHARPSLLSVCFRSFESYSSLSYLSTLLFRQLFFYTTLAFHERILMIYSFDHRSMNADPITFLLSSDTFFRYFHTIFSSQILFQLMSLQFLATIQYIRNFL